MLLPALVASASACAGPAVRDDCAIPGLAVQWQADYCMFESETDDVLAAQPCMDREDARRFRDACARKRHYKQALCRLVIEAGTRSGTVAQCERDPRFRGPTVRDGGT